MTGPISLEEALEQIRRTSQQERYPTNPLEVALLQLTTASDWRPYKAKDRSGAPRVYVRWIPVEQVLVAPWHAGRLVECVEKLQAGENPPAIVVVGIQLGEKLYYSISDGNHRTLAARICGRIKIKAEIHGKYVIPPLDRFYLHDRLVWRYEDDFHQVATLESFGELSDDVILILEGLGVTNWDKRRPA